MYDVAVVGCGPCGAAAARICASRGLSTVLLEEHGTVGHPVQCAGLLSTAAWEECRVSREAILHSVRGARVIDSAGEGLTIDGGYTRAVVVDRGILDREIAARATDEGATLFLRTRVTGIRGTTLLTRGSEGAGEVRARLILAADGVRSGIARCRGMVRPPVLLGGLQAETLWEGEPDFVEVHPHASPGFFGWVIPLGEGRARVGLAGEQNVRERFERFLERYPGPRVHRVSGAIPLGTMPCTYGDGVLYIGDAAGMVKPTSGGGVYTGLRSAFHAAETACACCEQERFDDAALARYQKSWEKDIGRELHLGYRLFRLHRSLAPEEVDRLIQALRDPELIDLIVRYGDMDRPGHLVRTLLRKPAFYHMIRILAGESVSRFIK